MKEVWIIGEGFLRSSFSTLQSMKTDNKVPPYIYQHYRLKPFYQASAGGAQGTQQNLYNSLIQALNNKGNVMPEYVIMIPDCDIILELNYFAPGTLFILD